MALKLSNLWQDIKSESVLKTIMKKSHLLRPLGSILYLGSTWGNLHTQIPPGQIEFLSVEVPMGHAAEMLRFDLAQWS